MLRGLTGAHQSAVLDMTHLGGRAREGPPAGVTRLPTTAQGERPRRIGLPRNGLGMSHQEDPHAGRLHPEGRTIKSDLRAVADR